MLAIPPSEEWIPGWLDAHLGGTSSHDDELSSLSTHESKPAPIIVDETRTMPTTLHSFNKFPQEIKDGIFQVAIDSVGSRIVQIVVNESQKRFTSPCPTPALLHACRSSRILALKRWNLSFPQTQAKGDGIARIFFDNMHDTLFFPSRFANKRDTWNGLRLFENVVSPEERKAIQKMAFSYYTFMCWKHNRSSITNPHSVALCLQMAFPGLKQIFFIANGVDEYDENGNARPVNPEETVITLHNPNTMSALPRQLNSFQHLQDRTVHTCEDEANILTSAFKFHDIKALNVEVKNYRTTNPFPLFYAT